MISFFRANLRETLRTVGILLLAAVTAAAWFALVQSHRTPPASDYVSPSTLTPPAPTPPSSETDEQAEESAEATVVAFLGDSYTEGAGASSEESRWSSLLAASSEWRESNLGWGGTGYANAPVVDGEQRLAYIDRIEAIVETQPDVIVISGGRNDVSQEPQQVQQAATDLFTQLQEELPNASIIVIAPWWDYTEPPYEFSLISESIQNAATESGVLYLDTGTPLSDPSLLSDDGVHPNDDGYAAIADAVTSALAGL